MIVRVWDPTEHDWVEVEDTSGPYGWYLELMRRMRPRGYAVDHIDGDRLNNHPDNLRLVSIRTGESIGRVILE
jgi:hypothetical protein